MTSWFTSLACMLVCGIAVAAPPPNESMGPWALGLEKPLGNELGPQYVAEVQRRLKTSDEQNLALQDIAERYDAAIRLLAVEAAAASEGLVARIAEVEDGSMDHYKVLAERELVLSPIADRQRALLLAARAEIDALVALDQRDEWTLMRDEELADSVRRTTTYFVEQNVDWARLLACEASAASDWRSESCANWGPDLAALRAKPMEDVIEIRIQRDRGLRRYLAKVVRVVDEQVVITPGDEVDQREEMSFCRRIESAHRSMRDAQRAMLAELEARVSPEAADLLRQHYHMFALKEPRRRSPLETWEAAEAALLRPELTVEQRELVRDLMRAFASQFVEAARAYIVAEDELGKGRMGVQTPTKAQKDRRDAASRRVDAVEDGFAERLRSALADSTSASPPATSPSPPSGTRPAP